MYDTCLGSEAAPQRCPFHGAHHFIYSNNSGGECRTPTSYVTSCASDAHLLWRFRRCQDAAYTYERGLSAPLPAFHDGCLDDADALYSYHTQKDETLMIVQCWLRFWPNKTLVQNPLRWQPLKLLSYNSSSSKNNNNNNNVYFAKGQVNQKRKSTSKLATVLRPTKQNRTKKQKRKKLRYKHLDKPMSSSLYILITSLLEQCLTHNILYHNIHYCRWKFI